MIRAAIILLLAIVGVNLAHGQDPSPAPGKRHIHLPPHAAGLPADAMPLEERDAKNETNYPPAGVVLGPVRQGVGQPRPIHWRHDLIGKKVQVEGLALGKPPLEPSLMTTQRVVYELGVIFVKGVDFAGCDAVGKTVRVTGTLQREPASEMTFDGHDPVPVNQYYYLDADEVTVIDRVTDPHLVTTDSDPVRVLVMPMELQQKKGHLLFPENVERAMIPEGSLRPRMMELRMLSPEIKPLPLKLPQNPPR